MKNKKIISIIMPVYNSGVYLKETIESILIQSYTNFELIIIDDFSTDNSRSIIEKYNKLDKRIIPIFMRSNKGVSYCRNVGIQKAKGYFVTFIDSDDKYKNSNSLQSLLSNYSEEDMIAFPFIFANFEINKLEKSSFKKPGSIMYKSFDDKISDFIKGDYWWCVWNKVFLLNIIKQNNISFPQNVNIGEDKCFLFSYIIHIKTILFLKDYLYVYRIHKNSLFFSSYSPALLKKNYDKIFESITNLCNSSLENFTSYDYLSCDLFYKKYIHLSKNYFNIIKKINNTLSSKTKKLLKQNLSKKYLNQADYAFAISFFHPVYRFTIFPFFNFFHYLSKKLTYNK